MIDGTPVLDVKPYIPEYDSPDRRMALTSQLFNSGLPAVPVQNAPFNTEHKKTTGGEGVLQEDGSETDFQDAQSDDARVAPPFETCRVPEEARGSVTRDVSTDRALDSTAERLSRGQEASATVAAWIRDPPVACLDVRFTPHAERQLADFLPAHLTGQTIL